MVLSISSISTLVKYGEDNYKSEDMIQAAQSIQRLYPVVLVVRGDGNCFYRSIIISVIAKSFFANMKEDRNQKIEFIRKLIRDNPIDENMQMERRFERDQAKQLTLHLLDQLDPNKIKTIEQVVQIYNKNSDVDYCYIMICRTIILNRFRKNRGDANSNRFVAQGEDLRITELLLKMGTEAEDVIISIAAEAFKRNLSIKSLYKSKGDVITHPYRYSSNCPIDEVQGTCEVLYTGGHYNTLFPKFYSAVFDEFEGSIDFNQLQKDPIIQVNQNNLRSDNEIKTNYQKNQQPEEQIQKNDQEQNKKEKKSEGGKWPTLSQIIGYSSAFSFVAGLLAKGYINYKSSQHGLVESSESISSVVSLVIESASIIAEPSASFVHQIQCAVNVPEFIPIDKLAELVQSATLTKQLKMLFNLYNQFK